MDMAFIRPLLGADDGRFELRQFSGWGCSGASELNGCGLVAVHYRLPERQRRAARDTRTLDHGRTITRAGRRLPTGGEAGVADLGVAIHIGVEGKRQSFTMTNHFVGLTLNRP